MSGHFLMSGHRKEPRWCCKRRSLAAGLRRCPAKDRRETKQNEQALLAILRLPAPLARSQEEPTYLFQ